MPPKKKAVAPKEITDHEPDVEVYKSTMLNATLYTPVCSCGWEAPRWFSEAMALDEAKAHAFKASKPE